MIFWDGSNYPLRCWKLKSLNPMVNVMSDIFLSSFVFDRSNHSHHHPTVNGLCAKCCMETDISRARSIHPHRDTTNSQQFVLRNPSILFWRDYSIVNLFISYGVTILPGCWISLFLGCCHRSWVLMTCSTEASIMRRQRRHLSHQLHLVSRTANLCSHIKLHSLWQKAQPPVSLSGEERM